MIDDKINLTNLAGESNDSFEDSSLDEQIREKVISNLLDMTNNSRTNSRINKRQVLILTKLIMFSETFNNSLTLKLAENILNLQVSIAGLGRRELVQILQTTENQLNSTKDDKKSLDIFR